MINKEKTKTLILLIILVIIVMLFAVLNIFKIDDYIHSDIVAEINFAQQMWEQKSLLPEGWYYAYEPSTLRPCLIAALFYGITGKFLLSQSLSIIVTTVLIICSYTYMMIGCKIKKNAILASLIMLLAGFGYTFDEKMFLYYGYYGFYLMFIFFITGYCIRLINSESIKYNKLINISVICVSFLYGIMGIRMTVFYYFPLIGAFVLMIYLIYRKGENINAKFRALLKVSIFLGSNILGLVVYKLLFGADKYLVIDSSSSKLIDITDLFNRICLNIVGMLKFVGILGNVPITSIQGIDMLLKMVMILMVILGILWSYKNMNENSKLTVLIFALGSIVALVMTSIVNIGDPGKSYWYFYMFNILLVIGVAIVLDMLGSDIFVKNIIHIGLTLIIAVSVFANYTPMIRYQGNTEYKQIAKYLLDNGYDFGYATFWNAGVIKAESDGKIDIAHINFINKDNAANIAPFRWLTDEKLFLEKPLDKRVVLILTKEEENILLENSNSILNKVPNEKKVEIGNYSIYEYQKSPITVFNMPAQVGKTTTLYPSGYEMRAINDSNIDYINQTVTSTGKEGFFLIGPYQYIKDGVYNIRMNYEVISNQKNDLGYMDLSQDSGKIIVNKKNFKMNDNNIEFKNIKFDPTKVVEFRAYATENTSIAIKSINIERIG